MNLNITFLGTGTSVGVPMLLSDHPVGNSDDSRDKRFRSSILIQSDSTTLLVDCSPDFRSQLLKNPTPKIDAILFTHEHSDHIAGLDDIRPYCFRIGPMPIYGLERVIKSLSERYAYIFAKENRYPGAAAVDPHQVESEKFVVGDLEIIPIQIQHGNLPILGYRIGDFAYLTDVKTISSSELAKLKGIKTLVVSCLREEPHPTHINLEEAKLLIDQIGAEKTYITHISHLFGFHKEIEKLMPQGVHVAYDNLKISV
ncbi:MAG: MBL fold metallo-hydrolase [Flavobacteriaceae bacterium]